MAERVVEGMKNFIIWLSYFFLAMFVDFLFTKFVGGSFVRPDVIRAAFAIVYAMWASIATLGHIVNSTVDRLLNG